MSNSDSSAQSNKSFGPDGYSREELVEELHRLHDVVDRVPLLEDLKQHGVCSKTPFVRVFGSWTSAKKSVFDDSNESVSSVNLPDPHGYSREELVEELHRLHDVVDRVPLLEDLREHGVCSKTPFARVFGGWQNAKEAVGFENVDPRMYDRSSLIDEISRLYTKLGRVPRQNDMRKHGNMSVSPFKTEFGSWNGAIRAAGYSPLRELTNTSGRGIPGEELVDELQRLHSKLGHPPRKYEMVNFGNYSATPYVNEFGSWADALRRIGVVPPEEKYSRERMVETIEKLHNELSRVPSVADVDEYSSYSITPFVKEFGSWVAALDEAGLERATVVISDEALKEELLRLEDDLGYPPTIRDMKQKGEYSEHPYMSRYGSWHDALETAGCDVDDPDTDIERIGSWILEDIGVEFEEKVWFSRYEADVVVEEFSLVIEWDGEYWHGHPELAPFDEIQQRGLRTGKEKNQFLADEGYTVIRVWGSDVRENTEQVKTGLKNIFSNDVSHTSGEYLFGPQTGLSDGVSDKDIQQTLSHYTTIRE